MLDRVVSSIRRIMRILMHRGAGEPGHGQREIVIVRASPWFDEPWYRRRYADVRAAGVDPALHYCRYGWREGRDPGPLFSTRRYQQMYPDVAEAGVNPLRHYIEFGRTEGRAPGLRDVIAGAARPQKRRATAGEEADDCLDGPDEQGRPIRIEPGPAFAPRDYLVGRQQTPSLTELELRENEPPRPPAIDAEIAVHVHLHHLDLLDEMACYLANIPVRFHLFATIDQPAAHRSVSALLRARVANALVEVVDVANRGRDIAPFAVELADELRRFDLVGHFHGKKSPHSGNKVDWRQQLLHNLLGSPAYVASVLEMFETDPTLGMVFPEYHWSLDRQIAWGRNLDQCRRVAARLGLEITGDRIHMFPAGSMYWARADAIRRLWDAGLNEADFPAEEGQTDATTAHAIERLMGEIAIGAGYRLRQIRADKPHSLAHYYNARWPYQQSSSRALDTPPSRHSSPNRIAVYTAIAGGYDWPVDHEVVDERIDFHLFTDRPMPDAGPWNVWAMDYHHPDPVRKARYVKTHPHKYFAGNYDIAIWVDANVMIRGDLIRYVDLVRAGNDTLFGGVLHPNHTDLRDEAAAIIQDRRADPEQVVTQFSHYRRALRSPSDRLVETNLMVIDLHDPKGPDFFRTWWGEIVRFTHRDQLSANYALQHSGANWLPLFDGRKTVRNHPDFAYFGHGSNSGRPAPSPSAASRAPAVHRAAHIGTRSAGACRPPIDIVVCVHDALDDVKRCLHALQSATRPDDRVIVVDDASGAPTRRWLDEFVADGENRVQIRHEGTARGYCRSANAGLATSEREFGLLLNSDTVVQPSALDKMFAAIADDEQIAIVGPLSNAASFQSIPSVDAVDGQTAVNPLPPGLGPADVDAWCERIAAQYPYPTVPLAHGFCQLLRRACLGENGLFDADLFPHGYGEENDLCLRLGELGYEHRIAIDCFVFHRKSASYRDDRRRRFLMDRGNRLLAQKYGGPRLANAVAAMRDHPVLVDIRARAAAELFSAQPEPENE